VNHLGIPNAQLVQENHPLAIQYNDQSIAEQRSLFLGFNELLKPNYEHLQTVMFPFTFGGKVSNKKHKKPRSSLSLSIKSKIPNHY
jgi:hypothetical protein